MKKLSLVILGSITLLCGCQTQKACQGENCPYFAPPTVLSENKLEGEPVAVKTQTPMPAATEPVAVAAPLARTAEPEEELTHDSAYDRFLNNVVIKRKSPNFVTYEYKDVRVDELAPIASRYCKENGNRTAVLRSVVLYKNYSRRATFDCLNLQ